MLTLDRVVDRLPNWARVILALSCVVVGVVLTTRPFTSIEVLILVVGVNAVATGGLTIVSREESGAHRAVLAGGWLLLGLALLARPSLSVRALAIVVGVALIVTGVIDMTSAVRGRVAERFASVLGGVAAVVFGVLALSWPDVTILVVAVLFGARTVLYGLSQLVGLVRHRRSSAAEAAPPLRGRIGGRLHLAWRSVGLIVALALLAFSVALHKAAPQDAGTFYTPPSSLPAQPGQLVRSEAYSGHGLPADSRAWLILYTTRNALDQPAVASAVVVAAAGLPAGPRPVILWNHGTTGVAQACAPSLHPDPFGDVPPIETAMKSGWVTVATDYAGMGTAGVSPYLIGKGEGYSSLDAVKAAHQIEGLSLSNDTVVWGHSQGGHAALWTGSLAPTYAPELKIAGVAALAPATDLPAMARAVQGHPGGALASSYVITAYAGTYPDVKFDSYVRAGAEVQARQTALRCLADPGLLFSFVTALPASQSVVAADPASGPLGERLRENTPTGHIDAPLLVAQGTSDEVIPYSITRKWVAARCAAGQQLHFIGYPDRTHMSVLAVDAPLSTELITWTSDRLAGKSAPDSCPGR